MNFTLVQKSASKTLSKIRHFKKSASGEIPPGGEVTPFYGTKLKLWDFVIGYEPPICVKFQKYRKN